MKKNFLTDEQKISYKNYGAIVIKNVFEPWIATLKKGFDKLIIIVFIIRVLGTR